MAENNDINEVGTNTGGGSTILQGSRLTGAGGGITNPIIRSGFLRPSVLGSSLQNHTDGAGDHKNNDTANDVAVQNPFMREQKEESEKEKEEGAVGGETTKKEAATSENKKPEDDEEPDGRPDPLTLLRKNGSERANLFAAAKSSIPLVEKSGFVFGQNVHERVVGDNVHPDSASGTENSDVGSTSGELLFSSVIQNAAKSVENDTAAPKETETKSLNEVAREYEQSRTQKRKFEEVKTFTGEENEVNIVDVTCKLFAFINSNWEERGRGSLRLNDSKNGEECSRVVFRTSGNLRLVLNTKVWGGMVAERPSQKYLRLTAMDNSAKSKIFLIMGRPADISLLHDALVERIQIRKLSHPEEVDATKNNGAEAKNGAPCSTTDDDEETKAASIIEPDIDDGEVESPRKTLKVDGEAAVASTED